MKKPAISVITVCRNAREDFLRTQASVNEQTCRDFEWIIIDGDSNDGTKDLLETLDSPWVRWISEPDKGIYDAMNKGLAMATGHRVWFMNAGDKFYDEKSLSAVSDTPESIDVCYGEVIIMENNKALGIRSRVTPHILPPQLEKSQFQLGMVVSHQAFIVKRSIAPKYQAARYNFSADLDWMLNILERPRLSLNLGILAMVQRQGASMDNWGCSQWERFRILSRHFGCRQNLFNHLKILIRRIKHGKSKGHWR